MCILSRPKQSLEIEGVFLHRVEFLEYFCPKQTGSVVKLVKLRNSRNIRICTRKTVVFLNLISTKDYEIGE